MINSQEDNSIDLFILVENGQPVNHPVMGTNLTMFFPDFDPENPSDPFEKFIRIPIPPFNQMEKYVGTTYEKINDVWQDVHHIEPLTPEEKLAKISEWESKNPKPHPSWIIDEENLKWTPPIPYPGDDSITYGWDEDSLSWCKFTDKPSTVTPILIQSIDELPVNGPSSPEHVYVSIDATGSASTYNWKNNSWIVTNSQQKLKDQLIINASLNDQQVKVMGVVPDIQNLDLNYQGDVADAYIIDNLNKLYVWDGQQWNDTAFTLST